MVFNIIGRNQDDHVKNIAFLMDRSGGWQLSPAFDMTYAYNATGAYTSRHQMTMNLKQDDFTLEDFRACAKNAMLKRGRAEAIVARTQSVLARWRDYAETVGVDPDHRERIYSTLRLAPISR